MDPLPPGRQSGGFVPLPLAVDLKPGDQVGEYLVSQKIGEGGMATVYGAVHPIIGKKAAIKVLAPWLSADTDQVERFVQEARAVNAIGHVNIVDVFAFGQLSDGRCYFIMEWLQGRTLYDLMYDGRPPLDVTLDVLDQTCEALEAAHEKGIVHRDLKPANVFLVPARGGRLGVKLLDFGVAKLTHPLEGSVATQGPHTESGKVVGTPDYISPEQARGQPVDGRTDLYALGVMAYELVIGRRPFVAPSFLDVLRMHLETPPQPPSELWPEIPSALERLILWLLEKKPDKRPTVMEARELIRELRGTPVPVAFGDTGPMSLGRMEAAPTTPAVPPLSPSLPARRSTPWVVAAVVAAAIGGALFYQRGSAPPAQVQAPVIAAPAALPVAPPVAPAPRAAPARLVLSVEPGDARILLDGQRVSAGTLEIAAAGDHQLEVSAPGRKTQTQTLKVTAGSELRVSVRLERRRASSRSDDPDYLVDPFGARR
jgi:eukaryotic-like serine/threonine-protein kinase